MNLTITHTHQHGTILDGTAKGDGSNIALKAAGGWRWSGRLGAWFVPQSRDRDAKTYVIDRAAAALREAGFEVEVEIDNTARDYAEVVADQNDRLDARAEALTDKAARKDAAAAAAEVRRRETLARVPEGGEPIKVGHHSEARHRNAIDKSWNALGKSVEADRAAEEAHRRAEASKINTAVKDSPRAVALRIDRIEAEVRKWQRSIASMAERGVVSERHDEGLRREQEKLDYWKGVHADNVAAGLIGQYSKDTVSAGDEVQIKGRSWDKVVRANPKTVTVDVSAIFGCQHTLKYNWAEVTAHRTAEQAAHDKAETVNA